MGVKNKNMPDKGAAVEKDLETFTIIPYIPGGILDPATLRKLADVAEKYQIQCIKMTSEHKMGFYGVKEEDIDDIYHDLGMVPGGHTGKCVRAVKFCTGNTFCKKGYQNTIKMGLRIDEAFHRRETPRKVKIALSGCTSNCAESAVRDIGLIGTPKGWRMLVGGTCGLQVKKGQLLAEDISDNQAMDYIEKILSYYTEKGVEKRLGRFIDIIGFDKFSKEVLKE